MMQFGVRRASTLISRNWKTEKAKGLSAGALSDLGGPRVALSARRESATQNVGRRSALRAAQPREPMLDDTTIEPRH